MLERTSKMRTSNMSNFGKVEHRTSRTCVRCSACDLEHLNANIEHFEGWKMAPKFPFWPYFFIFTPLIFKNFIFQFPKIFYIFSYNKNWLKCLAKDWKNGQKCEKLAHFTYLKMLEIFANVRRTLTANFEHLEHVFASQKSNIEHFSFQH